MKGGEGPMKESHSNLLEHLTSLYSGKPKAVSVCIVITSSTTVALDERCTSELFQTGPRGREGLARTFSTSTGVLQNKYDHVLAIPTRSRRESHSLLPGRSQDAPFGKASSACLMQSPQNILIPTLPTACKPVPAPRTGHGSQYSAQRQKSTNRSSHNRR